MADTVSNAMKRRPFFASLAAIVCGAAAGASVERTVVPLSREDVSKIRHSYFEGLILKAEHYQDHWGNRRVFVLGSGKAAPPLDPDGLSELRDVGFVEDHGGYAVRWEVKESNGSALCAVEPLTALAGVRYLFGETDPIVMVPYWISCDRLDPTRVKLIIVRGDRKYALRAQLPLQPGDRIAVTPGDGFGQLQPAVRTFAISYLDFVRLGGEA